MVKTALHNMAPRTLLLLLCALAAAPFVLVNLFSAQLYRVMDVSAYLVFHNVAELFSVMVSLSIFGMGWFAFEQSRDRHALFLSVAFLAIGLMDCMHTLGYAGMPALITPNSANKSTQFWIAVRFFGAAAFLASGFITPARPSRWLSKPILMAAALVVSSLVFGGVTFSTALIPDTFVQGVGLTPFKKSAEYVIIAMLALSIAVYWRQLALSGNRQYLYYLGAFILCIFSELVFAVYRSAFDTYNVLGHIYKVLAFGLIYAGIFTSAVKKPYDELRRNRNVLLNIMDSVPQSIFWKDRNCVYLGCNREFARQAGIADPDGIVGKTDFDLPWSREQAETYRSDDREIMELSRPKFRIEETLQQPNGEPAWVETTKVPLIDHSGTVYGVLGVFRNITDRKCAEQRKHAQLAILEKMATGVQFEELLLHIVNFVEQESPGSLCSLLLVSDDGTRLMLGAAPSLPDSYNEAVNGLKVGHGIGSCGTAAYLRKRVVVEEIDGHPFWKGFSPAQDAGLRACWSEPILSSEGELLGTFATYYKTPKSPGNEEIALIESAVHLASLAMERARSEEKHRILHEQLRQMQKIEAIGQLTAGIAHDFNNLLTPIFVYAEMIKNSLSGDDPNNRKIDGLISSALKAKELTQKLLSFSRKQVLNMECLDLNEVIRSLHDLLRSMVRENIRFDYRLSDVPAQIYADRGQLDQILVNLAVNALDAIESNGSITIHTGHLIFDDEYAKMNPGMKPGPHIMLAFSDNGRGIGEDLQHRIFEPFFTTKAAGHGTGLGLATVYGIVKQHDGYIQVRSRVGEGTTFKIYLPEYRGDAKPAPTPQTSPPRAEQSDAGKTILIVDDNPMILEMAANLLESAGYKALFSETPLTALHIAGLHEAPIDLLVTDVVMPEMNGPELYGQLAEKYPCLPVLYISGYTFDVMLHGDSQNKPVNFLPKPFTSEQFLLSIRQALELGY